MPSARTICENCGAPVADSETPYIHRDHTLCGACYRRLTGTIEPRRPLGTSTMVQPLGVGTIRKWHLTICHDLCIPVIPVLYTRALNGLAGEFHGAISQESQGCVALSIDGVILGGPTGGAVSTTCQVTIHEAEDYTETQYIHTLAHELRHAWHFLNAVPQTEEDANSYATRFLQRYPVPDFGIYTGPIDELEYAAIRARRKARRWADLRKVGLIVIAGLAVCGAIAVALACYATDSQHLDRDGFAVSVPAGEQRGNLFLWGMVLVLPFMVWAVRASCVAVTPRAYEWCKTGWRVQIDAARWVLRTARRPYWRTDAGIITAIAIAAMVTLLFGIGLIYVLR